MNPLIGLALMIAAFYVLGCGIGATLGHVTHGALAGAGKGAVIVTVFLVAFALICAGAAVMIG